MAMTRRGVKAKRMIPVFPTLTFPNHYTLVTGLLPAHHGIVANSFRDPSQAESFAIGKKDQIDKPVWWLGEPLWVTAEKQGMKAASMFWVGSSAEHIRPTYWKPYDKSFPYADRVNQVLNWLDLPQAERPQFITLYFEDVDTAGHAFGPASAEVRQAVTRVDEHIGFLLAGLKARAIDNQVNVLVVSDHGMEEVRTGQIIALDQYLKAEDAEILGGGTPVAVWPKGKTLKELLAILQKAHPHLKAQTPDQIPAKWGYQGSDRIPPILLQTDPGWYIAQSKSQFDKIPAAKGIHGFPPEVPSMSAFFVGVGPRFQSNQVVSELQSLDIYALICNLLGLKPAPNDGKLSRIQGVLKPR